MTQASEYKTKLRGPNARIAWIDTAKLIGIYLVILGHIPLNPEAEMLNWFIYVFHMPLFFLLSGAVTSRRSITETCVRSVRQLIVPYVLFYAVSWLWWFAVSFLRHPELFERSAVVAVGRPLAGMLIGCGFNTDWSVTVNEPLWFLCGLFWCRMLAAASGALQKRFGGRFPVDAAVAACCVIAAYVLWRLDRFLPFSLGAACMAYPFFIAGERLRAPLVRAGIRIAKYPPPVLCLQRAPASPAAPRLRCSALFLTAGPALTV